MYSIYHFFKTLVDNKKILLESDKKLDFALQVKASF